jgi:hypothetical protein
LPVWKLWRREESFARLFGRRVALPTELYGLLTLKAIVASSEGLSRYLPPVSQEHQSGKSSEVHTAVTMMTFRVHLGYTEDGGNRLLRIIGHDVPDNKLSHCTRQYSRYSSLDKNLAPLECKAGALPSDPTFFFFLSVWLYSPLDPGRFFSILIYTQTVGLLGRGISPSQGRYLHTEQHKHRINAHRHLCF